MRNKFDGYEKKAKEFLQIEEYEDVFKCQNVRKKVFDELSSE